MKTFCFSIFELDTCICLQKTVQSLLDCMLDMDIPSGQCTVCYKILEADEGGYPPDHALFRSHSTSCFQFER